MEFNEAQAKSILKFMEDELVVWVDTGGTYSVIREDFYVKLEERGLIRECVPVINLKLYGAFGRRNERVTKQALINLACNGKIIAIKCLVVTRIVHGNGYRRRFLKEISIQTLMRELFQDGKRTLKERR